MVCQDGKVHFSSSSLFFFFFLTITRSGRLANIKWSVCISKFQRSLCLSFSNTDSGLCICYLFIQSNFNFLHSSQWITFPTLLCLVTYTFCLSLLHLLIIWLIVSSLSPHNEHLLFCCVLLLLSLLLLWKSFCLKFHNNITEFTCCCILSNSIPLLMYQSNYHITHKLRNFRCVSFIIYLVKTTLYALRNRNVERIMACIVCATHVYFI